MKLFTLFACLLLLNVSFAQSIVIRIDNVQENKTALFSLQGEKTTFIDSVEITRGEIIIAGEGMHPGFYKTVFGSKSIDFVYEAEDIEISADASDIGGSLRVIKSESNKLYYEFLNLNKEYKSKSELLGLVLARYPADDDYYDVTRKKLVSIQEEYLQFVNSESQSKPQSFIARYIRSAQLPVAGPEMSPDDQLTFLKAHALDKVDFNDDQLIYSYAFTNKTIEYLTYFRNPRLPLELLEKEFITAIDSILSKARVNEIVYKHVVEYLLEGFKQYGFDNVLNYITENYVIKDDLCLDAGLEKAFERRIQQAKLFTAGSTIPDIILPDTSGQMIDLQNIQSDNLLIVFYASWCSHCRTLIPELSIRYRQQSEKRFEVIAVSIDTSRSDWLKFIRENDLGWHNVSDLSGWDGRPVLDYYIYATPTMFLADRNLKLIGRPADIDEIFSMLR